MRVWHGFEPGRGSLSRRPSGLAALLFLAALASEFRGRDLRPTLRPGSRDPLCFQVPGQIPVAKPGHVRSRGTPTSRPWASKAPRGSTEEVTASWSETERKALQLLEDKQPAWRRSYLGPKTEEDVQETFRAIAAAAGGEEEGLKAIERNLALMVFLPKQIESSAEALSKELGKEVALDVIRKNPGVLTIPPDKLKENAGSLVPLANVVGFFGDNPLIAQGLFGILGFGVIYAVVVVGVINPLIKAYPGNQP